MGRSNCGMMIFFFLPSKFCLSILSLQVLNILTSSKELFDLIKMADSVLHSKQAGSEKSMLNSLYRYIPSILEQLQVFFSYSYLFELCLFHFTFECVMSTRMLCIGP